MIIGFIGLKGSGKTTACNIIKKHINGVVQLNFKDALVAELKKNFKNLLSEIADNQSNLEGEWGNGSLWDIDRLFKEKPPLTRALMQEYGTEVRRKEDKNYWVKKWLRALPTEGMILVDDVRFINEAAVVKAREGILIRLIRGGVVNTDKHASEVEQNSIVADYTIITEVGGENLLERELMRIVSGSFI